MLASVSAVVLATAPLAYATAAATAESNAAITADQSQGPRNFVDLVARVKPAVISVQVKLDEPKAAMNEEFGGKSVNPFGGQRHEVLIGEGSGFFISPDGYAVTNNHVVDHASTVRVTTSDGTIYTAKVVGTDPNTDLAVIKVDADKKFAYVQFADHRAKVGQWVIAVGNPFGLGGTVTAGIVSALGRDIGGSPYDDYLQIDAPINRGNSGGPAFNMNGHVVGVNTAIYSPSGGSVGIGFDIPASTAKRVIDELIKKGYVTRGWLGVQVQAVTPAIAESLGMKKAEGALVDEPQADSPAAKAGVKAGDVITEVNGEPIKDARMLAQKIAADKPGSSVQLTVVRNGATKNVTVALGEMPKQQQEAKSSEPQPQKHGNVDPSLGLNLAPARDVAGSGDRGVIVLGVDPNGPSAETGVATGDVILNVSGKTVNTPSQVQEAVNESRSQGKHAVLMRIETPHGTRYVAVTIAQG
jgi:serine protease Do